VADIDSWVSKKVAEYLQQLLEKSPGTSLLFAGSAGGPPAPCDEVTRAWSVEGVQPTSPNVLGVPPALGTKFPESGCWDRGNDVPGPPALPAKRRSGVHVPLAQLRLGRLRQSENRSYPMGGSALQTGNRS
jgi:hypothetical protein